MGMRTALMERLEALGGVMGLAELTVRVLEDRPWGYCVDTGVLGVRKAFWTIREGCSLPSACKSSFCGTERNSGSNGN